MERRLSAILAADVVGYGRLVEEDEAATFERLRTHRKALFEPEIARHHGRIFKLMGDGLLAEFDSVVDAVECAVNLQRGMAERNDGMADDQRIDVRIGINLGDVIVEGEDRHGEGVVIAARLELLAEPGGIAVSRTVADHVKHKLALRFEPLGEHRVKNIAEPVTVYRVALGVASVAKTRRAPRAIAWYVAATAAVLTAVALVAWYSRVPISEQGIPIIVVLPFQDLTGDQVRSDLGKGIAEALITDLSTFPDFDVLSSTSSFAYVGKPVPEVVAATGALFVIEGSIRRDGDKAHFTVQLIRGSTDRHLKIAQFDEAMTDSVTLQSAVAARIREELGGMTGFLRKEYEKIARGKADADLTEYDFYVLGHIPSLRNDLASAGEIWKKGLVRFPNSVVLRCKVTFYLLLVNQDVAQAKRLMTEAETLRKQSQLDEWYYHWMMGQLYSYLDDDKRAVAEARAAINMAPYDTVSRANLTWVLLDSGQQDEAIEWAKFAVTNDPEPLEWYFEALLDAYKSAGKMREGVAFAEAEIRDNPTASRLVPFSRDGVHGDGPTRQGHRGIQDFLQPACLAAVEDRVPYTFYGAAMATPYSRQPPSSQVQR